MNHMVKGRSQKFDRDPPSRSRAVLVAIGLLLTAAGLIVKPEETWGQAPAPRCAGYGTLQSLLSSDWETGLQSWTADTHDVADPSTFDTADWAAVGNLPGGRPGMAAFVANIDAGDCESDDESGALNLDSPDIVIPGNVSVPRISLHHWFETELGWDGGNFKISVNGGDFMLVPASAIEQAPYNGVLFDALDDFGVPFNTNPLAEQSAYTGTADGQTPGSWNEVRVNLLGIAAAGDTIRFRFDFGVDECFGEVGWYVDDVEIYSCSQELPPSDCGNRVIDAGEQCDDGNDFIGDGCSNTCQVEPGWQCTAPPPSGTIEDPGFEAGTPNPFWDAVSTNPIGTPICQESVCGTGGGSGPFEGTWWAWFGGIPNASTEGTVSQSIVIPEQLNELTFNLEVSRCDSDSDFLEVLIDGNSEWITTGSGPLCGIEEYSLQSVDISSYADGGSHLLEFYSETFANNNGLTNFFVDEVALPGPGSQCSQLGNTSLTLVKQVINDDGGNAPPSAWTLAADGPTSISGPGPSVSSGDGFEAGTYDLSESDGPAGYIAGEWSCMGGNQLDGDTISLQIGESATCTITNNDIFQGFQINFGHAGAWYFPETSGQGQFIDVEPISRFIFMGWFTYTHDGSSNPLEQHWLTAEGFYTGRSADLILYESSGGRFDDPQEVTTVPVGTATLDFFDCEQGFMTYQYDPENLQGAFPLFRVIPGSENLCSSLAGNNTQDVDINVGMDGGWFDPSTSGQGYFIDVHTTQNGNDFIFLSWFTYGDATASGRRWLTAEGQLDGAMAELVIYDTNGGVFDDPTPPASEVVGSMTLQFIDCANALLNYSIPDEDLEGEIEITRVVPGGDALCEMQIGTN